MTRVTARRVLGADACRAGWVGITLSDEGALAYVHAEIAGLVALAAEAGPLAVVGIDIPIAALMPGYGKRICWRGGRPGSDGRRYS